MRISDSHKTEFEAKNLRKIASKLLHLEKSDMKSLTAQDIEFLKSLTPKVDRKNEFKVSISQG